MDVQVMALILSMHIKWLIRFLVYQCANRSLYNGRHPLHLLLQLYPHSKARGAGKAAHRADFTAMVTTREEGFVTCMDSTGS